MIAPEGTIAYIIDLLSDLEDAEDNLPGAMKRLETNAEKFKADAEAITKKFEYWEKVIMHLLKNSQDAGCTSKSVSHHLQLLTIVSDD